MTSVGVGLAGTEVGEASGVTVAARARVGVMVGMGALTAKRLTTARPP